MWVTGRQRMHTKRWMDSSIPTTLLQCMATLKSMTRVFDSHSYPISLLGCSNAVAIVTSDRDRFLVYAWFGEAFSYSGYVPVLSCSGWKYLYISWGTSGVDGTSSEAVCHQRVTTDVFFPPPPSSPTYSTQSVLMWLKFAEVLICSFMSVCSV